MQIMQLPIPVVYSLNDVRSIVLPSTLSMEQWNYVGTGEKQKVAKKKKSDSARGLKSFLERDKEEEYEVAEY